MTYMLTHQTYRVATDRVTTDRITTDRMTTDSISEDIQPNPADNRIISSQ